MSGDIQAKKIEYWKDGQGEWRYRVIAKNGEVVDRSHEGYRSRTYALQRATDKWGGDGKVPVNEVSPPTEEEEK